MKHPELIAIWQKVYDRHLEYSGNPSSAVDVANRAIEALAKATSDDDLLDYFAGQVIVGLATQPDYSDASYNSSARVAYNQAEAMLAEKAKREASRG